MLLLFLFVVLFCFVVVFVSFLLLLVVFIFLSNRTHNGTAMRYSAPRAPLRREHRPTDAAHALTRTLHRMWCLIAFTGSMGQACFCLGQIECRSVGATPVFVQHIVGHPDRATACGRPGRLVSGAPDYTQNR